jgi:assimilatory nitrate reductase catalytic subunit
MGSRLFANATSLLGGRDFLKAEHRERVAKVLHIESSRIPGQNSLAYDQIIQGIADGKIKGLWVVATNSIHSWIDSAKLDGVFDKLEFFVVQDMFTTTDTAERAHLILPAAGWGEKEGTFINSERRFGHVKKVSRAPGQALSDFNIFRLIAEYWGCAEIFSQWTSPQAAFQIIKKLSAGLPCDITGIEDYRHLDAEGGIQWPWSQNNSRAVLNGGTPALSPAERENRSQSVGEAAAGESSGALGEQKKFQRLFPLPAGEGQGEGERNKLFSSVQPARERRLFADGKFFLPDGKAHFYFDAPRPVSEPTDEDFPFVLLTGRGTSAQWHTNTRTGKSAVLRTLYPANPYVEIHPNDATRLRIESNSRVAVISRRARIEVIAIVTPTTQPGQVFIPMHYDVTNQLTKAEFDPHSRQPSYKYGAVRLEPIEA